MSEPRPPQTKEFCQVSFQLWKLLTGVSREHWRLHRYHGSHIKLMLLLHTLSLVAAPIGRHISVVPSLSTEEAIRKRTRLFGEAGCTESCWPGTCRSKRVSGRFPRRACYSREFVGYVIFWPCLLCGCVFYCRVGQVGIWTWIWENKTEPTGLFSVAVSMADDIHRKVGQRNLCADFTCQEMCSFYDSGNQRVICVFYGSWHWCKGDKESGHVPGR